MVGRSQTSLGASGCKLHKSLYGLPQASRCAQKKLRAVLTADNACAPLKSDECVYRTTDPATARAYMGTHVDDLILTGDEAGITKVHKVVEDKFKVRVKRNPDVILSVQVERDREKGWLKLHQEGYILDMLHKLKMENCKTASTPRDSGTATAIMLLPYGEEHVIDYPEVRKEYQQLVGMLIWLFKTRPDMLFTINLLSRFLRWPTPEHLRLAKRRPLQYLRGTADYGTTFLAGTGEWSLSGGSDADLGGDLRTSRSTVAHFTKVGEYGTLAAQSKLERKNCTATGQSETYGFEGLAKEIVWERNFLEEIDEPPKEPTIGTCDNAGVILQSANQINHGKAKHYRLAQGYIRDLKSRGVLQPKDINTEDNPADIFTKALDKQKFLKFRAMIMGPQSPPS